MKVPKKRILILGGGFGGVYAAVVELMARRLSSSTASDMMASWISTSFWNRWGANSLNAQRNKTHSKSKLWRLGIRACKSGIQPPNPKNSPSGDGNVGVNGTKSKDTVVSNPAAAAAPGSANGVRAATAWLICVHFKVRS